MPGPRVLLVDDDQEICDFLSLLLEIEGFTPIAVTRGDDAIEHAVRDAPDALLVDVAMPEIDGLELCRRLRAAGVRAPIVIVSARPGAALHQRATEAGADEFIRKPFDNAELVARLRHWTSSRAAEAR